MEARAGKVEMVVSEGTAAMVVTEVLREMAEMAGSGEQLR
jgi:hypothetical protein